MYKKVDPKMSLPKMEEEILKFWDENKIFEKSVESRDKENPYVFYDGPPFATGTPHYGHIVASTMKDVVPRFWTMKGYRVERKWGWDCHGLPIENIVEKELGSKSKKDIEKLGVDKFNELCRSKVLGYVADWKKVITRLGRWADMENSYKTMDLSFMESVWWVFKELWDKGLIYESYRSMHICPRCETTLSQSEVAEGYKDVKDLSVIAKFKLLPGVPSPAPGTGHPLPITGEGDNEIFILAWTTTPWTLIGNAALAVGADIDYVKIEKKDEGVGELVRFILAKDLLNKIFGEEDGYKIISEFKGNELVGKGYKPLFDYYSNDKNLKNKDNGWKIYAGDFVTTEEGTGVVHIAPAFGEDDMNLGKEYNLPFIQHVGMDGVIKSEAGEFAGLHVKPIENTQATDVEIIKYLAKNNLLFSKEKYEHSYPHCWRCETPLLNYATTSWFVSVEKIKERMLELAKDINWSPGHIKKGRWGNWLEGARDWSISRQRFWASVMPIWRCDKCQEVKVVGSVDEIREGFGNPNKLFLVRHGEAENNVGGILNSDLKNNIYHLTDKGKLDVKKVSSELRKEKIDIIFSSPFLRTKETAEIISDKLSIEIIFDDRLGEFQVGEFDGKPVAKFDAVFPNWPQKSKIKREGFGIESETEVKNRLESFLNEINKKYKNKNIVVVSHGDPLQFFYNIIQKTDRVETYRGWYPAKGSVKAVYSKPVDLHKHIVDKITFKCEKCEGEMRRVPDVLDTWFDSGSMPYAQLHYPFDNKEKFEKGYPAQFIAEGIDQTRAWFYYLHVIATGIKDNRAFSNVVVNGIVLAEDGQKMAKRLKNYPDPMYMLEKYGADSLRYYLTASPVMQAVDLNFKESDVADIVRGMIRMLWNSYSFFVLYANIDKFYEIRNERNTKYETNNLLDRWIISELQMLIKNVNREMEAYELTRAARLFPLFIDNLSNWYIRRSRKRFWKSENDEDKNQAYETLHYVLVTLAKVMAPFTPFVAEEIWRNLATRDLTPSPSPYKGEGSKNFLLLNKEKVVRRNVGPDEVESVHLCDFPVADEKLIDEKLNAEMEKTRNIITEALQLRAKAGIKVRQPLKEVRIKKKEISEEMREIIKEEVNVKFVIDDLTSVTSIDNITLNTEITEELRLEGIAREIVRHIQEMRKTAGYEVDNRIQVCYSPESVVFQKFGDLIAKETLADELKYIEKSEDFDLRHEFVIEGQKILIGIKR